MKFRPYISAVALLPMSLAVLALPAAAKCLDEVHAMAESRGITSKPPVAMPGAKEGPAVTTHELQRSGGVIAPPQTADKSVIAPPTNTDPGMATMPDAKPGPAPNAATDVGPDREKGKPSAQAGRDQAALQAALTAARAGAERGDEQACEESLAKARQIAEKP